MCTKGGTCDASPYTRARCVPPYRWWSAARCAGIKKEVEFSVVQGLKGMATGERFLLERGGGIDAQGDSVQVDMDGGAFQSGDTYLLLLKR